MEDIGGENVLYEYTVENVSSTKTHEEKYQEIIFEQQVIFSSL